MLLSEERLHKFTFFVYKVLKDWLQSGSPSAGADSTACFNLLNASSVCCDQVSG